jgi:hypothetical protein
MSWSIKQFFNDQDMIGREEEDFLRTSKTRANKKVMAIKQLLFAANLVVFIIISPSMYLT